METADDSWLRSHDAVGPDAPLRERKKWQTRQRISDVATQMFLERGFDEVRVSEIAVACDVSEKTIYNYFPTKESLLLDRESAMAEAIRAGLGPGTSERSPVQAAIGILTRDLDELTGWWRASGVGQFRRFAHMIDTVPSLRAAALAMTDRLTQVAAEAMAERAQVDPYAPEPQAAARALMGLWAVHFGAIRRHAAASDDPDVVRAAVLDETHRAARLLETGLWAFSVMVQDRWTREQLEAAADLTRRHMRQVASAVREARRVWRQTRGGHGGHHPH